MTVFGGMVIYCQNSTKNKKDILYNSTGKVVEEKQIRTHKSRRSIEFRIFDEMRKYQDEKDEFWESFLIRASKNNFPKNIKYIGDKLIYKNNSKKNRSEVTIDPDNLSKSFIDMKNFLMSKAILSEKDEIRLQKQLLDTSREHDEKETINSWKEAGKYKDILLDNCATLFIEKLFLNRAEKDNLFSVLKVGKNSEIFNNETVKVSNGKIISIDHLKWDPDERVFSLNKNIKLKNKKPSKSRKAEDTETTYTLETTQGPIQIHQSNKDVEITKKWEKFLEYLSSK